MARPSLLNEWWPHLLELEKYCQEFRLEPGDAMRRMLSERHRQLPGDGTDTSKTKMLQNYHREHREELKQELGPVPRTFELSINMTSPTKLTFAKSWRIKLAAVGALLVKNTKEPSG